MQVNEIAKNVTSAIIAALESGNVGAWVKPWKSGLPTNASTSRPYTGVNVLVGIFSAMQNGFSSSKWATYNQWKDMGAQVKAGSKGTHMVMFKSVTKKDKADPTKFTTYRLARDFVVFNAEQVEGYEEEKLVVEKLANHESVEAFVLASKASLTWGGDRACYIPSADRIEMPAREGFFSAAAMFSTTFHELAHWTGAPKRLNRDLTGRFGSECYAMEELIAELTAAMLCAHFGVDSELRADHAAYLGSWLKVLKADPTHLLTVASKASEAMAYLLGLSDKSESGGEIVLEAEAANVKNAA